MLLIKNGIYIALAGFGEVDIVNRTQDFRFIENGNSLMLRSELGYRFDKTGAIFIKVTLRWDRMDIDTPPILDDYFNKHSLLLVGFEVRLHL